MREDRHADENYCPPGVSLAEFTRSVIRLSERSPRAQRVHDHSQTEPCPGTCRVVPAKNGTAA